MKNRIIKNILVLVMAFFAVPIFAQDAIVVFFNDGTFRKFYLRDIQEISTSQYDEYGVAHSDYQYQHIATKSEKLVYDLSNINCIGFSKYDEVKAEQNFVKAMPEVIKVLSDCKSVGDAESSLAQIKEKEGVEDAWSDGHQLYVKIEEGETFAFHFDHGSEADNNWMKSEDYQNLAKSMVAKARKARTSGNSNLRAVIANQQYMDEERSYITPDYHEPLIKAFKDCGVDVDWVPSPTIDFFYDNSSNSEDLHIYDYDIILLVTHGSFLHPKYLAQKSFLDAFYYGVGSYDLKCHALETSEEIVNIPARGSYNDKWKECYSKFKEWRDNSKYRNVSDIDICFEFQREKRGGEYCWIGHPVLTEYFFRHIATGRFKDHSIFFNTACESLKGDNGPSYTFANVLFDRNLALYVGYTQADIFGVGTLSMYLQNMLNFGMSVGGVYESMPEHLRHETRYNLEKSSYTVEEREKIYARGEPYGAELKILPEGSDEALKRFVFGVYTNEANQDAVNQEYYSNNTVTVSCILTTLEPTRVRAGFEFGTNKSSLSEDKGAEIYKKIENSGKGNYEFSAKLTGLQPGNTYFYRAYTYDGMNYNYGEPCSFKIEPASVIPDPVGTETFTVNGVSFTMVGVEGGTFWMGADDNDSKAWDDERPRHQVTLSSFAIGETEVTHKLWEAVMGSNPSYYQNGNLTIYQMIKYSDFGYLPVEMVSWDDCQEFITKLNALTGRSFRLPTEAEWEFAARGGNQTHGYKYAGTNDFLSGVAWYKDISHGSSYAVGGMIPNELGLYDMSGNVWEWCQDWASSSYYSNSPTMNPCNTTTASYHIIRGGCYLSETADCRVTCRNGVEPDGRYKNLGLRLALSGGGSTEQTYTSCPDSHHPHLIDLGLPSGTKWACCNVGAEKPEDYGGYFAWGETAEKSYYDWDTYIHCDGSESTCHDIGNDIAGTQYDAATANWGSPWVMPRKGQMEELKNNCTSEWTTENGVNGRRFTASNGASIFLPAAGYRWYDGLDYFAGSSGYYWSSTFRESDADDAWYLSFGSGYEYMNYSYRIHGRSVRPVRKN